MPPRSNIDPGHYRPSSSRPRPQHRDDQPRQHHREDSPPKRVHFGGVYEMKPRRHASEPDLSSRRKTRQESSKIPSHSILPTPKSSSRREPTGYIANRYSTPSRSQEGSQHRSHRPSYDRLDSRYYDLRSAARYADPDEFYSSHRPQFAYASYSPPRHSRAPHRDEGYHRRSSRSK